MFLVSCSKCSLLDFQHTWEAKHEGHEVQMIRTVGGSCDCRGPSVLSSPCFGTVSATLRRRSCVLGSSRLLPRALRNSGKVGDRNVTVLIRPDDSATVGQMPSERQMTNSRLDIELG